MFIYAFLFLLIVFFYYHLHHKRRGLPPGPRPLPFFGNLLEVAKDPPGEAVYARWAKEYGPVYTYWLGELPLVAVTDYEMIMDTFHKDGEAFAGRWSFAQFDYMVRGGPFGVIFTEGESWKEQRRFALQFLRDFGLGKNLMQERIIDEIAMLFIQIETDFAIGQKEHDLYNHVDLAIGSIINGLLFSYGFHGRKKQQFYDLKARVQKHIASNGHPLTLMSMKSPNFYKKLPFFKEQIQISVDTGRYLVSFFRDRVREAQEEFDEDQPPQDYVHAFLSEWKRRDRSGEKHYFSEEQLLSMCYDLWVAGQETTSNTLGWCWSYLIHHADIQVKAHEELDRIIGSDRIITMNDRANLPYCNALINEVLRISNLIPQNGWHKTTKDVVINGYNIPKGTAIVPQISVVLSSDKIYPDAKKFDPSRFLDENGKLKRADELIAFSIGKRQCLGMSMALMELFLFITNILNRYRLLPGKQKPNLTRRFGLTVNPDHFTCRMEKRTHY
ncbi:Cytochrome P450-33C9 [Aphelenchoides besseyi]|nr:Cytochrome P450-33C9 [Aphelenchoides besseyi]